MVTAQMATAALGWEQRLEGAELVGRAWPHPLLFTLGPKVRDVMGNIAGTLVYVYPDSSRAHS